MEKDPCPVLSWALSAELLAEKEECLYGANAVQLVCDLNCGGRKFLQRNDIHDEDKEENNDSNIKKRSSRGK